MSVPNRIHIIGSTGSGKTHLAQVISKRYNLPYGELDAVMWSGRTEFADKNPSAVRDELLHKIIDKDSWIVEGIYYKWLNKSFERAELIIFLETNLVLRDIRIISRFIKQRLKLERSIYKQTVKGLIKMVVWNHEFERTYKENILKFLEPYKAKVMIIKGNKDIVRILEEGSDFT